MIVWLIVLPFIVGALVWAAARWRIIAAPIAAATLLVMAGLAITVEGTETLRILGRALVLPRHQAPLLAVSYLLLAVWMLYTVHIPQGGLLYPVTLVVVGLLNLAVMSVNLAFFALLTLLAATLGLVVGTSSHFRSPMAGLRALLILTLLVPMLLLANWASEMRLLQPEDPSLVQLASVPLLVGMALTLGVVPLHVWFPPVVRYGRPTAAILLGGLVSTGVLLRLLTLLEAGSIADPLLLRQGLVYGGLLTVVVAGVACLAQRSLRGVLAYASLADLGFVLLIIGLEQSELVQPVLWHMGYRVVAIVLVAMASGLIHHRAGSDVIQDVQGLGRCAPLALLALVVGGLSLAGLPPTAGFYGRFDLYRALLAQNTRWAWIAMVASIPPAWAILHYAIRVIGPANVDDQQRGPRTSSFLTLPLTVALLLPGLVPRLYTLLPIDWLRGILGV